MTRLQKLQCMSNNILILSEEFELLPVLEDQRVGCKMNMML